MTNEELAQIQAIMQAAIEPLATRLGSLEQGQEQLATQLATVEARLDARIAAVETTLRSEIKVIETTLRAELQATEQRIMVKLNDLEKLSAHYQDLEIRQLRRRVRQIEQHLQLPSE